MSIDSNIQTVKWLYYSLLYYVKLEILFYNVKHYYRFSIILYTYIVRMVLYDIYILSTSTISVHISSTQIRIISYIYCTHGWLWYIPSILTYYICILRGWKKKERFSSLKLVLKLFYKKGRGKMFWYGHLDLIHTITMRIPLYQTTVFIQINMFKT